MKRASPRRSKWRGRVLSATISLALPGELRQGGWSVLTVIIQNIFKKDSYIPQKNEECPQTTLGRGPRSSRVSHSLTNITKSQMPSSQVLSCASFRTPQSLEPLHQLGGLSIITTKFIPIVSYSNWLLFLLMYDSNNYLLNLHTILQGWIFFQRNATPRSPLVRIANAYTNP